MKRRIWREVPKKRKRTKSCDQRVPHCKRQLKVTYPRVQNSTNGYSSPLQRMSFGSTGSSTQSSSAISPNTKRFSTSLRPLQASTGVSLVATSVFIHCLNRAGCDTIRVKAYGQRMSMTRQIMRTEPALANHMG
jgi:hypothetical protein